MREDRNELGEKKNKYRVKRIILEIMKVSEGIKGKNYHFDCLGNPESKYLVYVGNPNPPISGIGFHFLCGLHALLIPPNFSKHRYNP